MKKSIHIIILVIGLVSSAQAQPDSLWSLAFGSAGDDSLMGMVPTFDGGYALAGYSTNDQGNTGCFLVRTDADGEFLWSTTEDHLYRDELHALVQTADSGFAMTGLSFNDQLDTRSCFFWRTDRDGRSLGWHEYVGEGNYDDGYGIVQANDNNFLICGVHYPGEDWHDDVSLRKVDADGNQIWMNHYGEAESGEYGISLIHTLDGGYAMTGQRLVFGEEGIDAADMLLSKCDSGGNLTWLRYYGEENWVSWAWKVIQTNDGGYAMFGSSGYSDPDHGIEDFDSRLIKTDDEGNIEWSQVYDLGRDENGMGIYQTADNGFILTGPAGVVSEDGYWLEDSDCFLIRTDPHGEVLWQTTYGGDGWDSGMTIYPTDDGGYIIGGSTSSIGNGQIDFWLFKTGPDPVSVPEDCKRAYLSGFELMPAYPNPFNSATTISYYLTSPSQLSLGLYNLAGCRIAQLFEGKAQAGLHSVGLTAEGLSSGSYIVCFEAGDKRFFRKLLLIR